MIHPQFNILLDNCLFVEIRSNIQTSFKSGWMIRSEWYFIHVLKVSQNSLNSCLGPLWNVGLDSFFSKVVIGKLARSARVLSPEETVLQSAATHGNTLQHCNTLRNTATHCKTLRNTATHCDTLRHTASHCNALQHAATQVHEWQMQSSELWEASTLQHTATHCNTLQHTATHCNTLQHTATYY